MVHPQDAHVGTPAGAALLDHIGRGIEKRHERHRARGDAHGRADNVVLGPEPGEAEAGAPARLVYQRHGAEGVVDAALSVGERVVHRKHEACGKLAQRAPRVHEGGRVRHEQPVGHHGIERLGQRLDRAGGRAIRRIRRRDGAGHAPEEILRLFGRLAVLVLDQVPLLENSDGVGRQRERLSGRGLHAESPGPARMRRERCTCRRTGTDQSMKLGCVGCPACLNAGPASPGSARRGEQRTEAQARTNE